MSGGEIHHGQHYRVVHRQVSDDPFTVVYFECWLPRPTLDEPPTAEDFFVPRGVNFIGIRPADNDWYQHDEISDAVAAIRRAGAGRYLVGYGASMGGFGIINFAAEIGLQTLLAVCPQRSIDRAVVPFEHRWAAEAAAIGFRHDRIAVPPPAPRGFVMFDPHTADRQHAEMILAHHPLTPLPLWFTGHEQLRVLTHTRMAGEVILGLLRGELDRPGLTRLLRATRGRSNVVWLGAAKALLRRGHTAAALRAMTRARLAALPDPFDAAVTEGEILHRLGRTAEAEALLTPLLDDPALRPHARWQLDQWRPPRPAAAPPARWWRRLLERAG